MGVILSTANIILRGLVVPHILIHYYLSEWLGEGYFLFHTNLVELCGSTPCFIALRKPCVLHSFG